MSDVTSTVDTYLSMWNETDPGRRRRHIERAWTGDGDVGVLAPDGRLQRITGFFGEIPAEP
jgi:hypothetical protein